MATERREIVRQWQAGGAGVLVTLVGVAGSSYRRPGARLLIAGDAKVFEAGAGASVGSISGGCLEADLVRRAAWLTRDGALVEHYSTAFDDTAEIPFGLGCGGELDCLLERSGTAEFEALLEAMRASLGGEELTVVTRLPVGGATMARGVIGAGGEVRFRSEGLPESVLRAVALDRSADEATWTQTDGYFAERLRAPQRLWVLGAGDDARPLVRMASLLGWSVTVADGRAQLARAERFPEAERVLTLGAGEAVVVESCDAVVVMTHSYEQDRDLLARVLPLGPRYLGLLGARHRSSLLVSEVAERLGWPLAACCAALHAPVGLDLGGDGAEAVALAVIAEVQACCHGRPAMTRQLSADDVRLQLAAGGASRYAQAQCALDAV